MIIANLYGPLSLCPGLCFIIIISQQRCEAVITLLFRVRKLCTERLSNLPQVTQPAREVAWTPVGFVSDSKPMAAPAHSLGVDKASLSPLPSHDRWSCGRWFLNHMQIRFALRINPTLSKNPS